jgi:hypothetical protein
MMGDGLKETKVMTPLSKLSKISSLLHTSTTFMCLMLNLGKEASLLLLTQDGTQH